MRNSIFNQQRRRLSLLILCLTGVLVLSIVARAEEEPSYERAAALWPDMRRPLTFLGCKDHPDEFAVMWNGNISAQTPTATDADRKLFRDRANDSLQLSFSVGTSPDFANRDQEDGTTWPSILEGHLPIAVIRANRGGMTIVQEAFVSDKRGKSVEGAWDVPVFLRLRFTVAETGVDATPTRLWVQVAANHTSYHTSTRRNIRILPVAPLYGRQLHHDRNHLLDSRGFVAIAADRSFRLHARLPAPLSSIALREFQLDRNVVEIELPRRKGAAVELIVPFAPAAVEKIAAVRRLSYQQALDSVRECWKGEIARGMQVSVPEKPLNELWRLAAPASFITADAYPKDERILKTAPHQYEACWVTLMAMNVAALARMGYLDEAAAYLRPFLDAKRRRPVPNTGASYLSASGFLSGPGEHVAISWVSDHGAVLWAASEYYLLTRDAEFLRQWLPAFLQGAEWISKEREQTKRAGGRGAGLMPPGRATDAEMQSHFVWSDAWTYRGLDAVCRVLRAIGHQDAAKWERERQDYRSVFQAAFRAQIRRTIRWLDPGGAEIPFIPWELGQMGTEQLHAFYLDTGPMFLGVSGLVDPHDDTMTWAMKWLTEGPDSGKASPDWSDYRERPSLRFEMSSSEPAYSWNIPLRFLRNERLKFLEGFYSLAAGAVSRKFHSGVETRDGIQGVPLANAVINMHFRNMLVFEDLGEAGIELLRNSPSAWLQPGNQIRIERAQTYFGPMGFQIHAAGSSIEADIDLPVRSQVRWIKLHLRHPEGRPIRSARVNGMPVLTSETGLLVVSNPAPTLRVVADF